MQIGLRHLTCFVAVAQERTLAQAAQRLRLSQPAVSKTLSDLERLAGRQLVRRGRAGSQLTPAGEEFLRYAAEATRAVDAAAVALSPSRTLPSPVLTIASLYTVAGGLLAPAIARLQARRPGARIAIRMSHNPELLAAVKSGQADLGVGRMAEPGMMHGISFELLYAESLAVVARAGHALAAQAAVSPRDLLAYPLVIPEAGTTPRLQAEGIFAASGLSFEAGYTETQSASVARSLTAICDAIRITPRHAVQLDLDSGWLTALPVPVPPSAEPVGLLTRSAGGPGDLGAELAGILRALA
jgi:DNA-binding transcriptional LysR family regulator